MLRRTLPVLPRMLRLAEALNDRFVALGRLVEGWSRKGERALSDSIRARLASRTPGAPPESGAARTCPADETCNCAAASDLGGAVREHEARDVHLAARTRVRLAELHLRVGQGIYQIESNGGGAAAIERQLRALLDEINRLEGVLGGLDGGVSAGAEHADARSSMADGEPESWPAAEQEKGLRHG